MRLQHCGRLPVGTQFQRPAHFGPRPIEFARPGSSYGNRIVRFGQSGERAADLVDDCEHSPSVGVARQHAIETQQIFGQRRLVSLEHADQHRGEIIGLVGHDHHARQYVLSLFRFRFDVNPTACCFERQIETPGETRDIDRPLERLGVTRSERQIGIGRAGQVGIPALQGNFRQQNLEDDLSGRGYGWGVAGRHLGPGVGMAGLGRRGRFFLPDRGRAPLGRPCLVSGPGKRRQRQRHHSRKGCQAESAMNDTNCAHGILGSR